MEASQKNFHAMKKERGIFLHTTLRCKDKFDVFAKEKKTT
jgi:hypothetical protein